MCGIVGFIGKNYEKHLSLMNDSQTHRGPDDRGEFYCDNYNVGLAMTRLAIVDIATGSQPMTDAETGVTIVFNGEIFNHLELKKDLTGLNHKFKTNNSDTEVILRSYINDGFDCIKKLNGMFSFAIFDPRKEILLLGRDRFGIKPLYYVQEKSSFVFSSELRAIHSSNIIEKNISSQSLSHYLSFQYIPAPLTIFENIHKLQPGSYGILSLKDLNFEVIKYWVPFCDDTPYEGSLIKRTGQLTENAVKCWLNSDVPVASSLSGGIDSTVVTSIASRYQKISTYSLGFSDGALSDFDETKLAAQTAKRLKTNHSEIIISEKTFLDNLDDMVNALEEPYGGGLPSYFIFKEVAKSHKVLLTGTGGDELFGNYRKHSLYQQKLMILPRLLKRVFHNGFLETIFRPYSSLYDNQIGETLKRKILRNKSVSSVKFIDHIWNENKYNNPNSRIKYFDLQYQLCDEFLHMTDKFSMYSSVEARTPLLDNTLVDFVLKHNRFINYGLKPKDVFIRANKSHLPDEIINRPKKGFIIPQEYWIKNGLNPLFKCLMGKEFIKKQDLFNHEIAETIDENMINKNNINYVWSLFMFQIWYKNNFE